jgi:hypothetical protein
VANTQSQNVQGFVYEDRDADGLYDGGTTDAPQAGVKVVIVDANGGVYMVSTDVTGLFRQDVAVGKVSVTVDERTITGISNPTLTTNANNQGANPSTGDVPAGGTGIDNTGYVSNATAQSVTGKVYEDVDGSGTFSAGDAPQAGAAVVITDSSGGLYRITTGANGDFSQAVAPGDVTIDVDETRPWSTFRQGDRLSTIPGMYPVLRPRPRPAWYTRMSTETAPTPSARTPPCQVRPW